MRQIRLASLHIIVRKCHSNAVDSLATPFYIYMNIDCLKLCAMLLNHPIWFVHFSTDSISVNLMFYRCVFHVLQILTQLMKRIEATRFKALVDSADGI